MAWQPDPAWIALAGTVVGTIGLKAAEHFLGKGRVKIDDAAKIRDELREQITANKDEIDKLEAKVEQWTRDYYDLRDKHIQLQTELTLALQKIKDESVLVALKEAIDKNQPGVIDSPEGVPPHE